jgi:Leucine-rich repeat (LRR) protein
MDFLLKAQVLDLSNNQLTTLNRSIVGVNNIRYLNLSRNRLNSLGAIFNNLDWSPIKFFELIDLSFNYFESLNFSFKGMVYLKRLLLSGNRLTLLNETTFTGLKALTQLEIDHNLLILIAENAFSMLDDLIFLNMSSNRLTKIHELQLRSLLRLEKLDLSNNSIEILYPSTFKGLSSLADLYIHMNPIKSIDILEGLVSVRNFVVDASLLLCNFTNAGNLGLSVAARFQKESLGIQYLKSVNVITHQLIKSPEYADVYCTTLMRFIKNNLLLNLKTDAQFDESFAFCQVYSFTMFRNKV